MYVRTLRRVLIYAHEKNHILQQSFHPPTTHISGIAVTHVLSANHAQLCIHLGELEQVTYDNTSLVCLDKSIVHYLRKLSKAFMTFLHSS